MRLGHHWKVFEVADIKDYKVKDKDCCSALVSDHNPRIASYYQCSCRAKYTVNGIKVCGNHLNQLKKYGKITIVVWQGYQKGELKKTYKSEVFAWKDLLKAHDDRFNAKWEAERAELKERAYQKALCTLSTEHSISIEDLLKLLPPRKDASA